MGAVLNEQGSSHRCLSGVLHLPTDVVISEQGSFHLPISMDAKRARKLAKANMLQMSSWNVGSFIHTFPIAIGLHQGSALSPYMYSLVMDCGDPAYHCML
jgi:hypothetical protein